MAAIRESVTAPLRASIYLRVSSPGQEENYSLPTQEEECRKYCAEHGYIVADEHVYRDGAQRSYTLDRPGLEAMREELRAGHIDVVVALKMDRLSRDQVQQGVLIYEADNYGVRLDFVLEKFDDTPTGRFIRSANGFVAEIERHNIRERTQRGRRKRAREGKLITGAFPLYGYCWRDPEPGARTAYDPDPDNAPIVRRIFAEVAAGMPLRTLARRLDAEGIPTPSQSYAARGLYSDRPVATNWSTATLHRLLMNPAYLGGGTAWRWRSTIRKERQSESGIVRDVREVKVRPADDEDCIPLPPDVCPPLIDRETAEAAWAHLRQNQREAPRRNPDPEATLLRTGYIFCGYCGHPLYTHRVRGKWYYFCSDYRRRTDGKAVCPSGSVSIQAAGLDAAVWEHVCRVLRDPEHITRALAQWKAEHQTAESRASAHRDAVDGQLRRLEAKMTNLAAAIAETTTTEGRAVLTKALDEMTAQIPQLVAERQRLQSEARERADHAAQVTSLEVWARTMALRLNAFTYQQKRVALHALGVRVTLWRFDHTPRYAVTFDFAGLNDGTAATAELLADLGAEHSSVVSASLST
jgi:site-specific DNA recombinase